MKEVNKRESNVAKINKFEDIQAWQKARELVKAVYGVCGVRNYRGDYNLIDQTRRAAVSIMANIAEGFGRRSKKEFANFLNMAHGSVAEVECHLYVALDQNYITQKDFRNVYDRTEEVSKMIQGFMNYLNRVSELKKGMS